MIIIIIIINAKRFAAPFEILSITNKSQHSCKKKNIFFCVQKLWLSLDIKEPAEYK